jgi:isopentenyl phosphate kinase
MRKHLVLVKMGGSLITDKAKPLTFRKDHIRRIASEVRELQTRNIDFLLGTGAGSFGHFSAHQYGLREGAHTPEQLYGMCVTHNATQRLSGLVADEFVKEKVAAFTLSPSSMISCRDGVAVEVNVTPIQTLLHNGVAPILHGDTITDTIRGTTILSTEKVFHECMKHLRSDYEKVSLIYLLDADGILDKERNLLPRFTLADELFIHNSHTHDVTGGIEGKVKSARQALEYADTVHLVNGMTPGVIEQVLAGSPIGTQIVR